MDELNQEASQIFENVDFNSPPDGDEETTKPSAEEEDKIEPVNI